MGPPVCLFFSGEPIQAANLKILTIVKKINGNINHLYTESEQVYEFYVSVPLGITHSPYGCLWHKQLSFRKPAKNEYIIETSDNYTEKKININKTSENYIEKK